MEPLAHKLRPKVLDDIVGQKHLIGPKGVIRRMVNNKSISSMILFGSPGIGKTTLANAIINELGLKGEVYNASTDNKEKLKTIITKNNNDIIIIDEIHRMKKDIQDYLLPCVERGEIIMIGITTINPYRAVEPAVRSRAQVFKLFPLNESDIMELIDKAIISLQEETPSFDLTKEAKDYISKCAGGEGRSTINMIEALYFSFMDTPSAITYEQAKEIVLKPTLDFDKNGDGYYNTLSGLHKSIRGSDVNASLHYLSRLLYVDDLKPLCRRLLCVAYEDISLANPGIGPKVWAATQSALELGMPEARLPLASIVVEMALSPKSNSTYLALEAAMKDIEDGDCGSLPPHLKNVYSFEEGNGTYKYPHDYPGGWVKQQYLPDKIKDHVYYVPKTTSKNEELLKERYEIIQEAQKKK